MKITGTFYIPEGVSESYRSARRGYEVRAYSYAGKDFSVVREFLGPDATEEQIQFSEVCIISMCIHPMLIRKGRQRTQDSETPSIIDNIDAFSDHVIKFALVGIASIRQEIKTGKNGF